jgi:hypothetical protein
MNDVMQCPDCEYHTKPIGRGRGQKMVRNTLIKHLIHIHGYSRREADDIMKKLGYSVEGTDLAESCVEFEAMIGGSL